MLGFFFLFGSLPFFLSFAVESLSAPIRCSSNVLDKDGAWHHCRLPHSQQSQDNYIFMFFISSIIFYFFCIINPSHRASHFTSYYYYCSCCCYLEEVSSPSHADYLFQLQTHISPFVLVRHFSYSVLIMLGCRTKSSHAFVSCMCDKYISPPITRKFMHAIYIQQSYCVFRSTAILLHRCYRECRCWASNWGRVKLRWQWFQ